jgi:hypothetical protein
MFSLSNHEKQTMDALLNSPALNKKPQGVRRLRWYVNRNGWIRDYISPVGGALNT